jgi:hypothetical protein
VKRPPLSFTRADGSRQFPVLGIVLLVAAAASCGQPAAPPDDAARSSGTCSGEPPSYPVEVAPLVTRYCSHCHSKGGTAGEEHDFSRYEVLHAQRRRVLGALQSGAMPPVGSPHPSASERSLLIRWACLGAPDR